MSLRKIVSYSDEHKNNHDEPTSIATTISQSGVPSAHVATAGPSATPGSQQTLASEKPTWRSAQSSPQRWVVIPDPVAFRFLEGEPAVSVVERRAELRGYELYLVEQWACSRQSPTLVIVTYTGDVNHVVVVGVLSVPADENAWSKHLRAYFKAIHQYHARPANTELGEMMITNLSSFPSALTVISVPDGDIKNQRRSFIVNENLKRLGCSGRSGMTLSEPSAAAKAKFRQLYKTNSKIPVEEAVTELVKICQVALYFFGHLDQEYIDGLLCDVTETAIGNWWTEFGTEYFHIEPTDGILGPTTVAALLGLLGGARNRLNYIGAPVAKDVFDIYSTERGISYFQKYQKLERTRRLDRQTIHRLHAVTARAAAGEAWGVQKAVKSTVTEIGGKRGEMVLGMVGSRDKGGIGDIETTDLDRFIGLVTGESAKWLWHGKPKRTPAPNHEKSGPDMILLGKDDIRTSFEDDTDRRRREDSPAVYSTPAPGSTVSVNDSPGDKDAVRRGVFKSVARDARSGLGRIKDVMTSGGGLRSHASRLSRDEHADSAAGHQNPPSLSSTAAGLVGSASQPPGPGQLGRAFTWRNKPEEYLSVIKHENDVPIAIPASSGMAPDELSTAESAASLPKNEAARRLAAPDTKIASPVAQSRNHVNATVSLPATGTVVEENLGKVAERAPSQPADSRLKLASLGLRRRHSISDLRALSSTWLSEARWARRLSFGDAEEAVLKWEEVADFTEIDFRIPGLAQAMYLGIAGIEKGIEPWVISKIQSVEDISETYLGQLDQLDVVSRETTDAYRQAEQDYYGLVKDYREQLTEGLGKLEGEAAKLEYEITALVSRVKDAEEGAAQFELQVQEVEQRAEELKAQLEKEGWLHWAVRTLTGIGTGPNITRPRPQR
ncbi:hypothetical protein F5Y17DRAFT_415621 [Xylariaceae sp. FL0594]|nr:hypothetical protein F5Y17DRAFT_415621 [Xylariaceae sp. FL0594]